MEKTSEESMASPSMMTYVVGAVLVVAVVGGAWYFRSKSTKSAMVEPTSGQPAAMATPASTPISGLACDQQYFNPKIGFNEYYLSAAGGDVAGAKTVTCAFTASVDGDVVASATAQSPTSDAPQRGGSTFVCTTKALPLDPNVETIVDVVLSDDLKSSSTCSATFTFPPQI